jgi:RND family efflux transporter MFP subunit
MLDALFSEDLTGVLIVTIMQSSTRDFLGMEEGIIMNRGITCAVTGLLACLVVLSVGGCGSDPDVALKNSTKASAVRVRTVAAEPTEITQKTRQPASLHPFFETEIRSKVSGFVTALPVDIGDYVEAGAKLAEIDVPEMRGERQTLERRIDLLSAEEQAAEAEVDLADAAVRSAEAKLEQARSELGQAEASLAAAEAEFSRTNDLVQRGSLQTRILDEVRMKRDSEAAAKLALSSAVLSAEAEVAVFGAKRAAAAARRRTAEAQVEVARSELAELDVTIAYASVTAPFAGIVTERHADLGDLIDGRIGEGSLPLFVLSQVDKLRVHVPVPEVDAPFVQPGDALTLTFPSFRSESPIETQITRISGALDPSTRTMTVEAVLENPDRRLLPGMFGEASIDMDTKLAAKMLPSRAVRFDESGKAFVYVVGDDDRVRVAEVTTGIDTGTHVEIVEGIGPGQTVIDSHLKRFSDGQLVERL